MSAPNNIAKPIPEPDEQSQPFFAGGATGQLMITRCRACQAYLSPEVRVCTKCLGEELEWAPSSGRATLHTFGVMHQRYHPGFEPEIPYNIAVVELEEGPRMSTNIVGCRNEELRVGMPLAVTFDQVADGVFLPKFRPAGEAG